MNCSFAIEVAPFTLADSVSEEQLLIASGALESDFLSKADGYLGRVLVRRDDRRWLDIVYWQSSAHSKHAMEKAAASEA